MNILHLSDIHFGRNYPCYGLSDNFKRHDEILEELIEIISDLDDALKPEHILFTGDIVWHGKTKEYAEAEVWFKKLLKACNLTGKDISFCVGNHDIDLSYTSADMGLTSDMVSEIDELYRYENIHKMEPCMYAYNNFCKNIGTEPYVYPYHGKKRYSYSVGYKDVTFGSGKTVRLLSMNTSLLMTQHNIPDDKMWLGREQIKSLMRYGILPSDKNIWYTIALFHHSDRFLHPNETSTYDGRSATLPLMMNFANLLLCGHTESGGRPRLVRQLGGGTILLGGAAYYSDDHTNAFSMIYVSDKKPTMGYIPYVYENGWTDYDFYHQELDVEKCKSFAPDGKFYENVTVVCRSGNKNFKINFDEIEVKEYDKNGNKYIHLDSGRDISNDFYISEDIYLNEKSSLKISLNPTKNRVVGAILNYDEYCYFADNHGDNAESICEVVLQNGEILLTLNGFSSENVNVTDRKLLEDIRLLEKSFDVIFKLPSVVTDRDKSKIEILKTMATKGYTDRIKPFNSFTITADYDRMNRIISSARFENLFQIKREEVFSINLFGVNVSLGKVTMCSFPFKLDMDDAEYKFKTFREDDVRTCVFNADGEIKAYIVTDYENFAKEKQIPNLASLGKDDNLDFKLDF